MAAFKTLDRIGDVKGKRVLVRVDLNVPVADGKVTDATRIERVAPTILELSGKDAKVILLAHFGRPKGGPEAEFSLAPDRRCRRRDHRQAGRIRRRLHRPARRGSRGQARRRRHPASGKHALPQGRGEERSGLHRTARRKWRHLRQRRLLRGASCPRLHRRARAPAPGLRRHGPCRPSSKRSSAGLATRRARSWRSSAAPRSRPRSTF